MIRWIIDTSLHYRFLVLSLALALLIVGFYRIYQMPVDVFPEFEPPVVEIQTEALGLSADEVESLVTLNVEEFLSGTPWLESIRSESVLGLSSIQLLFQPGTDIMQARQVVQESLSRAYTLPNVSKPPVMLQPLSTTNRAMMVAISSKEISPIQLSVLARWTIKPKLMGVPGVANVVIWGQKARQLQVLIDPKRLKEEGLTQDQIIKTTGDALWWSPLSFLEASVPGTGGWIETPNQRLGIRHVSPISSPEDLAKLPISGADKLLGDVTEIVEGHPPLIGDTYLENGQGIILVIEKLPNANTLEVTKGVEKALDHLKAGLPGLEVDSSIFRLADYIEAAFSNLALSLVIGFILVGIILWAFLNDWRLVLISLISIPLSLLAAVLILNLRDATLNIMVLVGLGIALGVVVDDAIIDVDNIIRRLRQRRKEGSQKSTLSIVFEASLEVRTPIIYATLIMILAILPVFFLQGVVGKFFEPLALSYTLALLASMFIALTVTPALSLLLLKRENVQNKDSAPLVNWLHSRYYPIASNVIKTPKTAFMITGIFVLAGLATLPFFDHSLLPPFKERTLLIEIDGTPGTSHPEISRITNRISKEIRKIDGVEKVGAHTGRAITGDRVVGIYSSQIWATLKKNADYEKTINSIRDIVSSYEGVDSDVLTYLSERIRDVISGDSESIVVRLYGPQRKVLREKSEEVKNAIAKIDGIIDLAVEGQAEEPHIEVKVDINKAKPYGIKPGDVRRAAATVFAGIEAGYLFEEQKVFDVVVWGTPASRNSITDIVELLIDTPNGEHVRLGDIADISIVPSPTIIYHEAISPRIDIVANVKDRDVGTVTREVNEAIKKIKFPLEYHPEVVGEYIERQNAQNLLIIVTIFVLVGIYLLLQASFGSWTLASLAFIALPIAVIGGLFLALLTGANISLGTLVGFLAVLGIAARNTIMLIRTYQRLEYEDHMPLNSALIIQGTKERFGPILLTAATTIFALLPVIVLGKIAGLEIEHSMAVVILGGLISSTLLILFIIPPLYLMLRSNSKPITEHTN